MHPESNQEYSWACGWECLGILRGSSALSKGEILTHSPKLSSAKLWPCQARPPPPPPARLFWVPWTGQAMGREGREPSSWLPAQGEMDLVAGV